MTIEISVDKKRKLTKVSALWTQGITVRKREQEWEEVEKIGGRREEKEKNGEKGTERERKHRNEGKEEKYSKGGSK